MATHSSILAWRILWAEEPGWLQSMGCKRVRHDYSDYTTAKNMCINESLCCTPETNITLQINYPSTINQTHVDFYFPKRD